MNLPVPHDIAIGGIYFPPLLIVFVLGVIAALLTARLLTRYRLAKHFYNPPLVLLALIVIFSTLIGTFIIGT